MDNSTQPLRPVPFWINFGDSLTAPSQLFRRVASVQPRSWWFPALLAWVTPILYVGLTMPLQIEEAKHGAALSLSTMTPEQAEMARGMVERLSQPGPMLLTAATSTFFGLIFSWAFSLLILYFGISFWGAKVKAGGLWAAVVWAWMPFALRPLMKLAWSLATHSLIHYQGLSSLFATGDDIADQSNVLFALAAKVDAFTIWYLILVFLLVRKVGNLKRHASLIMTIIYTLIYFGAGLLPVLILKLTKIG